MLPHMVQPLRCTPAIPKDENGEALHMQTRPSTLRGAFRVATVASILLTVWPGSSLAAYAPTGPVLRIATSPAIPHFLLPYMITTEIVGGTITDSYPEVGGITGRKWAAPTPFCTGTLISPHVFITAAHCLFSDQQLFESDNPQPYDPSLLQVVYDSQRYMWRIFTFIPISMVIPSTISLFASWLTRFPASNQRSWLVSALGQAQGLPLWDSAILGEQWRTSANTRERGRCA